ncbi:MAG TPA: hypothetical protein VMR96_03625, partial [Solirubrobacterales bacterium]|nr:hypothetical protein [Solirubrobacterales bacterium]
IVAVPFLLGGGSDEEEAAPAIAGVSSAPSPEPAGAKLTVVEAKPGLRDYRKRLREHPTDPFVQRYTSPQLGGTKLGGGGGEGSASPTSTVTKTSSSSTTKVTKTEKSDGTTTEVVSETGSGSSPGGTGSDELTLFSFAVDLKIVRTETKPDGSKEASDPEIRRRVIPPASLPSEKEQAVTYMGISPKTQQPLFLISDAVSSLFGEAHCLSGAETCQLIEVAPGLPMTYVYGPSSIRYKITVLKVEPVAAGQADAPR